MRGIQVLATLLLLLPTAAGAQDRLVLLGVYGTDATGQRTADFIEADMAGTAIGSPQTIASLSFHTTTSRELVSIAGARYIAWLARVDLPSGCREYVAIFDRRVGTAQVVPNLVLPCDIAKLVGDRRRARLFLHTWTTVGGLPGMIARIDEDLAVRPMVISRRLGTAFAYAPDADQLFVTYLGTPEDPGLKVAVFSGSTGEPIRSFPARDARNLSNSQMRVSADGRRVFLWTGWGHPGVEQEIRAFDGTTGVEAAASQPVYIWQWGDRFVVDERRNLLLTPHADSGAPNPFRLLAFDATTLAFVGEANPGGYRYSRVFQPFSGHGTAGAFLLIGAGAGDSSGACRVWVDAFDGTGAIRTRTDVPQIANSWCLAAGIVLSPPDPPSGLAARVDGRRVTLTWTNPGDTSEFELEAGLAPGRRDFAVRVGPVTEFSSDDVPPGIYYVRVRAVNEIGMSPVSNEVRVVVP